MTPEVWFLLAGLAVLLLAWAGWTLTRLRRLEVRVDRAWTTLDAQLQRRAALAEELARCHPAALGEEHAARLAAAAGEARTAGAGDRELAENGLGRALRELPGDLPGVPAALRTELAGTATRVVLARRFYNDAVRDTRELRGRRLTVLTRVHAGRPLPRFFDIDDRLGAVASSTDGAGRTHE
ncbi:LemA family protein [Geodermatophilus sp. YIM 151500]|uniref:LemA family protein n=1 Tax=Geodermatophilus sp. YIM 151500 TaxID=2984531 RepID=UPI0021E3CBD8|nr:LemA family protein [Geodermatophilus sp. YIM 151500]MCV2491428.1 LemA family protein [Geodermatophilus sp. YIM 151500]